MSETPELTLEELKEELMAYVDTSSNPMYHLPSITGEINRDWETIDSKFPKLKGIDPGILKQYVDTANNPKYEKNFDIINSRFPDIFPEYKKETKDD